jgi:hypothetical protein
MDPTAPVSISPIGTDLLELFLTQEHPKLDLLYVAAAVDDSSIPESEIRASLRSDASEFCSLLKLDPKIWRPVLVDYFIQYISEA